MARRHERPAKRNGVDGDAPRNGAGANESDALTLATVDTWQPRTPRRLTGEDAQEIVTNIIGFFELLQKWDLADRASRRRQNRRF